MADSWRNCFEEELLCPICLNVFDEPVQLACKHNFCRGCISEAWAKDTAVFRCPECNHDYNQKPSLEKNIKLANIVEKFNALNVEKQPDVLHCILCRRGPPLPVQKVCLRCNEPCCQSHIQTHLQQPCPAPGHLLVDPEEVRAWSCPRHEEYRLLHCDDEQVAVCQFCCISRCASQRHDVCDVDTRRKQMQLVLMRQQERLDGRVQDIDEQLCKLESDETLVKDAVCDLKEQVRAQYRRMQALLEEDLSESMQLLDKAHSMYRQKNSQQALQLSERRQEADKLLSSTQLFFDRAGDINFMKNTKPCQLLMDRSKCYLGSALPPFRVGQLNSHLLLSELRKKESSLRTMLEEPFSVSSVIQSVPSQSSCSLSSSSGPEKRQHSAAFPEGSAGTLSSLHSMTSSKQPFLSLSGPGPGPRPSRVSDTSAQHMAGLGPSSSTHSGSLFPPSHYPGGGAPQQAMLPQYGGRKILVCSLENCCCSRVPPQARPSYPASGSFPWVSSQEYPPHPQGLSMRNWIDASQTHQDFYGLYGQSSAKHYVTS